MTMLSSSTDQSGEDPVEVSDELFAPVGKEGHRLLSQREGKAHWEPALEAFLRELK